MCFCNRKRSLLFRIVLITTIVVVTLPYLFYRKDNSKIIQNVPPKFERFQQLKRVNKRHADIGSDVLESPNHLGDKAPSTLRSQQPNQDKKVLPNFLEDQKTGQELGVKQQDLSSEKDFFLPSILDDKAPGEMGRPVKLPKNLSPAIQKLVKDGWKNHAFNQYVSDMISVRRSLPDLRDPYCLQNNLYLKKLPSTSVIICFHNEAWSTLLRTVHSVLDRSPSHLIHEIILVDDYSNMLHTKKQLETYMAKLKKIKIIRTPKREGLIRARLYGARVASGSVLTYLDSHCECTIGWLEPLLDRIARDPTTVATPVIGIISDSTFEYYPEDGQVQVGGFTWDLIFDWHMVSSNEAKRHNHSAEPVRSPTMAGGLFSINRKFFQRLGTYDDGFEIWGGENLELSFKTWMCGGKLEIIPCSNVGHIFRKRSPYKWGSDTDVVKKNTARVAEVWLDEYAKYFYQRIGGKNIDFGDVLERKKLRQNLGCKSFKWYLDNIYPELYNPGDAIGSGQLRSLASRETYRHPKCLDSNSFLQEKPKPVEIKPCHKHGGNQFWLMTQAGEITRDDDCLDYSENAGVVLHPCHKSLGNQQWFYDASEKVLRHGPSGMCLGVDKLSTNVTMETCLPGISRIQWSFQNYDPMKLVKKKLNKNYLKL